MSKEQKAKTRKGANGGRGEASPPPAYFLSLEVENVRCFGPKQELDLSDGNGRPAQWTVILGDNGVGKTTILQCLAALEPCSFTGLPKYKDYVVPKAFIEPALFDTWRPARSDSTEFPFLFRTNLAYGSKLSRTRVREGAPHSGKAIRNAQFYYLGPRGLGRRSAVEYAHVGGLVCYGYSAARRMGGTSLAEKPVSDSTASLFSDDTPLLNAEEWLLQADYAAVKPSPVQEQARKRRDEIKSVLIEILPDVDDIEFTRPSEQYPTPGVRFKTPYGWVSVQDLSLDYRSVDN